MEMLSNIRVTFLINDTYALAFTPALLWRSCAPLWSSELIFSALTLKSQPKSSKPVLSWIFWARVHCRECQAVYVTLNVTARRGTHTSPGNYRFLSITQLGMKSLEFLQLVVPGVLQNVKLGCKDWNGGGWKHRIPEWFGLEGPKTPSSPTTSHCRTFQCSQTPGVSILFIK